METIRTERLCKTYANGRTITVKALKGVDLTVAQGEIFGLLGPNGAGKTTLVKLLLGIVRPSSGAAYILGNKAPSRTSKELVGYLPENHRFPLFLTGRQMLEYYGALAHVTGATLRARIKELLQLVALTDKADVKIKQYSKGMLQRLGIAQALLNRPKLLVLDEPTDGVDPVGRRAIRDILLQVKNEGSTIFVNSHLLSEVELITDRVAILKSGEVVTIGATHELTQSPGVYLITITQHPDFRPDAVPGYVSYEESSGTLEITAESAELLNIAIDSLRRNDVLIRAITPKRNTLEELFFDLIDPQ